MKPVKKSLLCIVLSWFMVFGAVVTPPVTVQAETTVYVTRTGSKYHTHKCGNGTYYASSLSSAKARGLTPCQKCFGSGYTGASPSAGAGSGGASVSPAPVRPARPAPKPISLNAKSMELVKGKAKRLKVKNASGAVRWTSSDKTVATVSDGVVKAKGAGRATITAVSNGQERSCKVKVEAPHISRKELKLVLGSQKRLKVFGCSHGISWRSNKSGVASVNKNGYVSAGKPGTATITGKVHGKKYACKVTVALPKITEAEIVNLTGELDLDSEYTLEVDTDNNRIFDYIDVKAKSSDSSIIKVTETYDRYVVLETNGNTGSAVISVTIGDLTLEHTFFVTSDFDFETDEEQEWNL